MLHDCRRQGGATSTSEPRACVASHESVILPDPALRSEAGDATLPQVCVPPTPRNLHPRRLPPGKMSRRQYEDEGADEDWNTVADPAFDPTDADYTQSESPRHRGRRGRGSGGRRGRAAGGMSRGRGAHPEGDIVAATPRNRGSVSDSLSKLPPR